MFKFLIIFLGLIIAFTSINVVLAVCDAGQACLENPLGTESGATNPNALIGKVISAVLGVVGSLALLMFIYGGFTWMLAAGNNEKVQKGKDILIWATIGLVVIFTSYALVKLVFQGLGVANSG